MKKVGIWGYMSMCSGVEMSRSARIKALRELVIRDDEPQRGDYLSDGQRLFRYEGNGWVRGCAYSNITRRPDRFQLDTRPELLYVVPRDLARKLLLHWVWVKKHGKYRRDKTSK